MSTEVPVQCSCGHRGTALATELGRQRVCERCGQWFLLWPAEEKPQHSPTAVWHLQVGSHELGPFEVPELRRFVQEGRITPEMPVRRGTAGPWTPARLVRGLLDGPPPSSTAPAPRAPAPATRARPPARKGAPRRGLATQLARQPATLFGLVLGLLALVVAALVLHERTRPVEPPPQRLAQAPAAPKPRQDTSTTSTPSPIATEAPPARKAAPTEPERITLQELARRASPSVAVVQGRRGSGSGFLLAPGMLATNRHVIEDELIANIRLQFPDAEKSLRGSYGVSLRYVDPELDLAFLDITIDLPPLRLARKHEFARGAEVAVIGSPGALDGQILQNALARGLLSTEVIVEGLPFWQLDVAVNPGNSGGPVFDDRGEVIGVVTLKDMAKDGLGFCVPLTQLKQSLERAKSVTPVERGHMEARHRLTVIVRSLIMALKGYDAASSVYLAAMKTAAASGQEAAAGLGVAQDHVDDLVRRMDGYLLVDLREQAPRLLQDKALGPATMKRVERLYKAYLGIRKHVLDPTGVLADYQKGHEYWRYEAQTVEREFAGSEGIRLDSE